MSTMIATRLAAYQVAAEVFDSVAKQSAEYREFGGTLQPGQPTLLHMNDIGRKLARHGLDSDWTQFVVDALAEDGVLIDANGRVCTPVATW